MLEVYWGFVYIFLVCDEGIIVVEILYSRYIWFGWKFKDMLGYSYVFRLGYIEICKNLRERNIWYEIDYIFSYRVKI